MGLIGRPIAGISLLSAIRGWPRRRNNFLYLGMRKAFFVACALLILVNTTRAQGGDDTVAIQQVKAAWSIISKKPDSALAIAENALQQSQRTGSKRLAANAYKTGGWAWLHIGNYYKAFSYLLQAKDLFQQLHDEKEEMYIYTNLGMAYSMHSEFGTG